MKSKIKRMFQNADNDFLNTLAERYTAAGIKEREKIYIMISQKNGSADNYQYVDIVRGMDIYRRPKWHKAAAVTASLAATVLGISGTFYSLSRFSAPGESSTNQYHSVEESTKVIPPEIDITTKEGIYQKMLNSIYYYDKVSGELVLSTENSTDSLIIDFESDLEKSLSYSNSEKVKVLFDNDNYIRENELFTYCDGNKIYKVDTLNKTTEMYGYATKRSEMTDTNDNPARYSDVTNLPYVSTALMPRLSVLELIKNSENWMISGTEIYLDRECTIITGDNKKVYADEHDILSYWLCVDNKTGVILKYFDSVLSGEYQHVMLMRNIAFDDDVEVRDLADYVRSESLSSYDSGNNLTVTAAVVGYNERTGFIITNEIFSYPDPAHLVLNVYDTDLKTVIDEFRFGNYEAEREKIVK